MTNQEHDADIAKLYEKLRKVFKPHPWHGIRVRPEDDPRFINAYIEMVPSDTVKYEIEKKSGYLMVDRPQKFSNLIPSLYGFLPRTYCGEKVANFCMSKTGRTDLVGDADPLDVCVLTEKSITHGDLLLKAVPIGGFRMIDHEEVDDKIIAVLKDDPIYSDWDDVSQIPSKITDRLRHYFLTYKEIPGRDQVSKVEITHMYGRQEAEDIITLASQDYLDRFGGGDLPL